MLCLTRKDDQSITLYTADGPIKLVVVEINRRHVKLGIEAPSSVVILRDELISPSPNEKGDASSKIP